MNISATTATVPLGTMIPLFRSLADAFCHLSEDLARSRGETISCKKGCGACCRQAVPIAGFEAIALQQLIERMPEPRKSQVLTRFADAARRMEQAGILEKLRRPERLTPDEQVALGLQYFDQQIACPFLEDESCSIHPDRPLACREYLVVTPAEYCSRPAEGKVRRTETLADVASAVRPLDSSTAESSGHWLALILAMEFADSNSPAPAQRPGTQWADDLINALQNAVRMPRSRD